MGALSGWTDLLGLLLAENFSSQQQAHHAAPARPLTTPQQQPQQPHFGTPPAADSLQAPSTVSRWLACSFKAGLLGVAAYDRLSNEVSPYHHGAAADVHSTCSTSVHTYACICSKCRRNKHVMQLCAADCHDYHSHPASVLCAAAPPCACVQLSVLQTSEESKGPGAFQMLQYIKLQVNPEVRLSAHHCSLQACAD